jgi:hypothetical protein
MSGRTLPTRPEHDLDVLLERTDAHNVFGLR